MSYLANLANELRNIDLSNIDTVQIFITRLENHLGYCDFELQTAIEQIPRLKSRNWSEDNIEEYKRKIRLQTSTSKRFLEGIIRTLEGILRTLQPGYQQNLIRGQVRRDNNNNNGFTCGFQH